MSRGCAVVKHGAYSHSVERRYRDGRTSEGKELNRVMAQLVDDLGGQGALTQAQRILLGIVRSKIAILMQLGAYIDRQTSIIDVNGKPLECLGTLHLGYTKSLRQDLETLCGLDRRKARPGKSLADWIGEQAK